GLGSLGFKVLRTTDVRSQVQTTSVYSQQYPYAGIPVATVQVAADGVTVLSEAVNTPEQRATTHGGIYPFIDTTTETQYQVGTDGIHRTLGTTVTDNDYDGWGNLTRSAVQIKNGSTVVHTTITTNNFGSNDSYEQQKGRLQSTTVTKTPQTGSAISRSSSFGYYGLSESCNGSTQIKGMLKTSSINGLTTTTCYDAFGYKSKVTKTGKLSATAANAISVSSTSVFSADGRVIASSTNTLAHTVTHKYNDDVATGSVTGRINNAAVTDVNGLTVKQHFDVWNQVLALETPATATKTTKTAYCTSCTANSKYYVETAQDGMPTKRVIFDKFGREIAVKVQHFDNATYSYQFKDYDALGRLEKDYFPTFSATRPTGATTYTKSVYDAYSRAIRIEMPNTSDEGYVHPTTTYAGFKTTKTDAKGQVTIETQDVKGQLSQVEDAKGGTLVYGYDAFGHLKTVTKTADGVSILQVNNSYNSYGQKTQSVDIDRGTWSFGYNDFGQSVWQKNANGVTTTTDFDTVGRKERQYAHDFTQCWIYGTATPAKGKLTSTRYFDGLGNASCSDANFTQATDVEYDKAGRVFHTSETIKGLMSPLDGQYHQFNEFDVNGRLSKQRYPALGLTIRHEYQNGYASKLVNDSNGRVYQHITKMDVQGQVKSVSFANGTSEQVGYSDTTGRVTSHTLTGMLTLHNLSYEYQANGNLAARTHGFGPISQNPEYREEYDYDSLNRLTGRNVIRTTDAAAGFSMNEQYAYNGFGSFTQKQHTGYYRYDANQRLTGVYGNAAFTGSKLYDFDYDHNGNILGDGKRNLQYASFDKPVLINQGETSTGFIYGMGHKRFYRHDQNIKDGKEVNTHTAYLAGAEKIYRTEAGSDNDLIEHKFYVGNVVITESTNAVDNDSTAEAYLHKDHLGSPLTITDKIGHVIAKNVYDPWGKVQQLFIGNSALLTPIAPTTRGFTGHEGVQGLDIIHMNGRIYDPVLGRFLQADPVIQAPTNSQNYNRYAYVLNNPLSYTDPSGHFFKSLFKAIKKYWKQVVSIAAVFVLGPVIGGMLSGYLTTGSLKGALLGAFTGALGASFGGLDGIAGFLVNGAVGGLSSKLTGGKFGHGFLSAGIGQAVGGSIKALKTATGRILAKAVVGGTVSKLTGGKFANGALTSAFAASLAEVGAQQEIEEATADDVKKAKMAKAVYDVTGDDVGRTDLVEGYTLDSVYENYTGMKAALFIGESGSVLAFAGTDMLSGADWKANLLQAVGFESAQHTTAFALAKKLYGDANQNLQFTGHSLGGGIAAAAAIRNGGSATVFNAAGVHNNTLNGAMRSNGSVRYLYSSHDGLRLFNMMTPASVPGVHINIGAAGPHMMGGMCDVMGC
ncbi:MAG: DUF2974 domain-containing protein, partial [Algicola sp.]|nr:DUF2974 domain-containing protein [Algicola sp.]